MGENASSRPLITERKALAEVLNLLFNQAGFHVIVSANEGFKTVIPAKTDGKVEETVDVMRDMEHSGFLVQMPEVVKGAELSPAAERLIKKAADFGIFDEGQYVNYNGRLPGTRPEQIVLPLQLPVHEALAQAFHLAQLKTYHSPHEEHYIGPGILQALADEAGFTLAPYPEKPPVKVQMPDYEGQIKSRQQGIAPGGASI